MGVHQWQSGIYSGMTMLCNWRRQIPKLASQNIQTFWTCKARAKASSVFPKTKFAKYLARLTRNCVWIVEFPYVRTVVTR